ncbi:UPF0481 protein At3g47200 isoform X1 [Nicotiana tabacum]|uniref:UPF0481 protein At3g02645 isoform X1 n=3 Tax=Nicotiana tabacum TaxID=4097 RepID=A0A1S4CPL7_TOBAC|nr:PREDICTED: putative UPF0481 protein At3g02645 isoform X1 [Nicotiana tabacum]
MAHSIEMITADDRTPLLRQSVRSHMEEGRKVDHVMEIKETNSEDQSRLQTSKSRKQIFDERFKDLNSWSTKSCTIFKVNVALRESNPDAYTPKLIPIGPYHNKNPELGSMEKYKMLYLQQFLQRKEGLDMESCIRKLEELKDEALKCYEDIDYKDFDTDDSTGKFVEMLLVDGCFVVEYIREDCSADEPREGRIINTDWMVSLVNRDLLLLENQLPFSVLTKLHDMTTHQGEMSFTKQVEKTFLSNLSNMCPAPLSEVTTGNADNMEPKHIRHVLLKACQPSKTTTSTTESESESEHSRKSLCWNPLQLFRPKETQGDTKHITLHGSMPNATELCEAGVTFSKVQNVYRSSDTNNTLGNRTVSLFDIKFEKGLMKIPSFEVVDLTETLLRNLIAFEQHWPDVYPTCFSDYVTFMDYLIESEKDVSLLRLKGIIRNRIGEDKEVASIFNKMGKGVAVSCEDFYYKEEYRKLIQHCEKPWNRMKANLRHNYFSSPWAGASTVAAAVLLILTAMQTILAFRADRKK